MRLLDAVLPADLARDELRVVDHLDVGSRELTRELERQKHGLVLRDVVRRLPDVAVALGKRCTLLVGRNGGPSGGSGVAARAPVDVNRDFQGDQSPRSGGKLPGARRLRRSRTVRRGIFSSSISTGAAVSSRRALRRARSLRRSFERRSMMTFTFGSSL